MDLHDTVLHVSDLVRYLTSTPGQTDSAIDKADIVQALNIITSFGTNPSATTSGSVTRSKFYEWDRNAKTGLRSDAPLGGGILALRGFYDSARTSTARLVNIHGCTSVFYPDANLADVMQAYMKAHLNHLEYFMARVSVSTHYIKPKGSDTPVLKIKLIKGLAQQPHQGSSLEVTLHWEGHDPPEDVSVAEYFQARKLNIILIYRSVFMADGYHRLRNPSPAPQFASCQHWHR